MRLSKHFKPTRQRREYTAALLAISLSLLAIFVGPLFRRGSAQRLPDASAAGARNAALIAATNEVLKETSELRQLSILEPVQSSTQSRAEIERMIVKHLDAEMTADDIHAAEINLKRLGLAPLDFQYHAFMIRLLSEQVAGYYDPKARQFHLADWIDLDGQRPVMAHELTHALQDQHFNLRRFEHWPKGDSDAQLATHALVEGDATLAMAFYIANNPLRALAFLKSLSASGMSSQELAKAPRALRETLLFPYQEGTAWTKALYRQGGWAGVSKAFSDLPQSTEQILHPEKYFAHEQPVKVVLPDIMKSVAPASAGGPRETGWRKIDSDVEGEWGFYLILDQFLESPTESRRAAEGWGGDRYAVYEGPKSEILFISLSTWDSANDAREFFDAYAKRTRLRYADAEEQTHSADTLAINQKSWKTTDGTVTISLRGSRVAIIEAPNTIASALLLRRLGQ
jgi:hypothetical protein